MDQTRPARRTWGQTAWLVLAAIVADANAALLVLFGLDSIDAGSYGVGAWPSLLLHPLVCGGLCAAAAASVLRRTPRALIVPLAVGATGAGLVGSFRAWAFHDTSPFLGPFLAWAAVPAVLWALAADSKQRPGALVAALGLTALWLVVSLYD